MDSLNNGMPSGLEDFRCVFQYASWTEYWRDSGEKRRGEILQMEGHIGRRQLQQKFGCIKS